jgi:hypothetical protein
MARAGMRTNSEVTPIAVSVFSRAVSRATGRRRGGTGTLSDRATTTNSR